MNGKRLSRCVANKVYDVLVKEAGATESGRIGFVYSHTGVAPAGIGTPFAWTPCFEYRFCGKFGFGGKYWSDDNKVTYYPEDKTKKLDRLLAKVNKLLNEIK